MKWWFLASSMLLIVLLIVGGSLLLRSAISNQNHNTGGIQKSTQLIISSADDGRTLSYSVGDQVELTTGSSGSVIDLSNYNKGIIDQLGSTALYQPQRLIKFLSAGQTGVTITFTAGCAIPKPNQPVCLIASRQINLTITVK